MKNAFLLEFVFAFLSDKINEHRTLGAGRGGVQWSANAAAGEKTFIIYHCQNGNKEHKNCK